MGISGRINPKPTRSMSTVKNMIPSDFFFMQAAIFDLSPRHTAKNPQT
jgi:hypothetical protein